VDDLLGEAATLAELRRPLADLLVEGGEGGIVVVHGIHLLDRHHDGGEIVVRRRVLERGGALLALQQELHAAEPALDLADAGDDAHRVEDLGRRLVGVVALRDGEDESVALERRLDRPQRPRTSRRDGRGEPREDDRPPQRKDGQGLSLSHELTCLSGTRAERAPEKCRGRHSPFQPAPAGRSGSESLDPLPEQAYRRSGRSRHSTAPPRAVRTAGAATWSRHHDVVSLPQWRAAASRTAVAFSDACARATLCSLSR
jgi:hypothetical protein